LSDPYLMVGQGLNEGNDCIAYESQLVLVRRLCVHYRPADREVGELWRAVGISGNT
jgi:hypothetical protein